jgi:hypothetical protein
MSAFDAVIRDLDLDGRISEEQMRMDCHCVHRFSAECRAGSCAMLLLIENCQRL